MSNASNGQGMLISPMDAASVATGSPAGNLTALSPSAGGFAAFTVDVRTNTSQQVRIVAQAASTSVVAVTYGWIDSRGRFN